MNILVTGAAGFIGFHVAARLLDAGCRVLGIDNLNPYYDPSLKRARLARLASRAKFEFMHLDIADRAGMVRLFENETPDLIVHLAAQVGVRHSVDNPHAYVEANLTGFLNVLEGARRTHARHLIYASSSSVYGSSVKTPFAIADRADTPLSFYAATKRANELMAHCYWHLYGIPSTGLRFFTVYGPWGRPDMAPFRFARAMFRGETIDVYNHGDMQRDFTYVDDVAEGVHRVVAGAPDGYRLFNIGNSAPVNVMDFIRALECALGSTASKRFLPLQPGDVVSTCADVGDFQAATGFAPATPIAAGVERFVGWYREFYGVQSNGVEDHEHGGGRSLHLLQAS
ncbi:MAG TPA: NAD-dependent epimerase/dehydratase family protein [Rhizomicrobium sp.]|nr:NAD-dependent epimerase/dehydratase family protein [Rhizomicrobium sp.]